MDRIKESFKDHTAAIAVVGLGYVGLPLALRAVECGFHVTGLDSDETKVSTLHKCRSSLLEISDHQIRIAVESGRFSATADPAILATADVIIICVPTPLRSGTPDMTYIAGAATAVAARLRPHQLVVLESTTYPGTTDEYLREILESTGLKAGIDFYLGFSPERIDPGNVEFRLENVPKIVGGCDDVSTELMTDFYGELVNEVVRVSSTKVAEMAKLLENTYRHVNIALANEMAILCNDLGIDVWEVIDAAATKPFGFEAFYPGPGWGGHCIPVDPAYLSWRVRQMGSTARFVELAREFNEGMPGYVFQRIAEVLNERDKSVRGASILVLGVAYKPNVNDARETPARPIIEKLQKAGALICFHDPYVDYLKVGDTLMGSTDLTVEALSNADLILLHTSHAVFNREWISHHSQLIFDTRNYFKNMAGPIFTL